MPVPSFFVCALAGQLVALYGISATLLERGWPALQVAGLDLALLALGWGGARGLFALGVHLDASQHECSTVGGLSVLGGILGTAAALVAAGVLSGTPPVALLDASVPFAALGLALGRVGCLLGGCDYGAPVAAGSPWPRIAYPSWSRREPRLGLLGAPAFVDHLRAGLLPPGATRSLPVHPVPVYWIFTLIPLGILLLLWPPGLRVLGRPLPASLLFALAYAGLTWTLEPLRGDPDRGLVGGHSLAEWGTGLLAAAGLAAWIDGRLVAPVLLAAAVFVADALALRLAWRRAGRPGWRWILNPGAAAGLLAGCPGLHVAVTAACLGAALLWLSLGGAQSDAALGLFCGGAAANLHHRVRFGGVVDYWPLPASPWVVSLGDIALTAALLWLLGAAL